ncbi:geraniol 8-hydroxylase-like isoform X1 [Panicum miliaceum]|uniref:Geraniol 8-hydroxylase-like isoform X1 n=1 Tax=Panicum miliaceum TaxID=4540 RepID=A0A3L6S138_PANMI|nr:geraniol 8-hydroxylase-like isoform X1 [Panicum miliaceum]
MAAAVLLPWLVWLVVSLLAVFLLDLFAHACRGLPPGPRPLPLLGSLHLLGDQPHRSLARLAKIHGPLMSLRLGSVTTVVVSSPEVAREFLQKHDAVFASRSVPDAVGDDHARNSVPWLPHSTRWRALRKIMATELFAPHRLDALQGLRREKVQELVDHVGRLAREGTAVDVGHVAFTTSLNLLSRTMFSCDLTSLDDVGSKVFQEVVTEIMETVGRPNLSDFFPALAAVDPQRLRRRLARLFARLHKVFDVEVDGRLRERDAGKPRKNDFLDLLLDATGGGGLSTAGIDRDTLRSFFTDLFAAGSDTSSSTVEWAMVELLRNPVSMSKLCNELVGVIGSRRTIEESDIGHLPYLQAVVKETFRLHPPVPLLLPRQAEVATEIMGYIIPKGARVLINVWAMGRDEDIWFEPKKFMPERFLESTIDFRGGDFGLIPFGEGRRICPGMPLATRMVHLVLASLLNKFKWRLPAEVERNGVDMAEKFGVTLKKASPLCAIATPI